MHLPDLLPPFLLFGLVATVTACATATPMLARGIPLRAEPSASSELVFLPATELARRLDAGEVTSVQVVQAFIDRIAAENGRFNAVVWLDAEGALRRAREADEAHARGERWGALHGVPVTVKDTFEVKGLRTTAGSTSLADYVPQQDSALVALLRAEGAIVLAKTNAATLAMDMQTTNALFGTTRNAWDPERTPGGSSGGCVTALATGMSPLSFGSDLAGSIRLPSSYSGVYGLKPTFGTVSMQGHVPPLPGEVNGIRSLAVAGPMARSIEDLELALEIIARPHPLDQTPRPLRAVERPPRGLRSLRLAVTKRFGALRASREVEAALDDFVARLRAAGVVVDEVEPGEFSADRAWETWGTLVGLQGGYEQSNATRWLGSLFAGPAVRDIPHQRTILGPHSVERYMRALEAQQREVNALETFLTGYDAWLVPVSVTTAIPHRAPSRTFGIFNVYDEPMQVDDRALPYYVVTQAFTTLTAVTESPVVSMPIGVGTSGLPVGVQVVGRRFEDRRLLQVARLLDTVGRPRFPLERVP